MDIEFRVNFSFNKNKLVVEIENNSELSIHVFKINSLIDAPFTNAFSLKSKGNLLNRKIEVYINKRNNDLDNYIEFLPHETKIYSYNLDDIVDQFEIPKKEKIYLSIYSNTLKIKSFDTNYIKKANVLFNDILIPEDFFTKVKRFPIEESFHSLNYINSKVDKFYGATCPPIPTPIPIPWLCYSGHHEGFFGIPINQHFGYPVANFSNCQKVDIYRSCIKFLAKNSHKVKVSNNPLFKRWFGVYNSTKARKVKKIVGRSVRGTTCSPFTTHDSILSLCQSETYAIVVKNLNYDPLKTVCKPVHKCHTLQLCNLFWQAPLKGKDSKIGTIIHEFSHIYGNTKDHAYGKQECLNLAISNSALAIENADSYQYYIEEYFGW